MDEERLQALINSAVDRAVEKYGLSQAAKRFVPGDPANPAGAPDGRHWKSFGDFLGAIKLARTGQRWDNRLMGVDPRGIEKDLSEGVGSEGGFLVPEEYRNQLLQLSLEGAVMRPGATVFPMVSDTLVLPAIVDSSHASSVFGGIVAYWEGEAATITASEPTFGRIRLTARKLAGYTVVGNELLADSAVALERLLLVLFSQAISFYEDDAFINGQGTGEPLGIANSAATIPVAKETGQAADTLVYENLVKMESRMFPSSLGKAVWFAAPDVRPQLYTLALNVGTGGAPIPAFIPGAKPTLMGYPILFTEKCAKVGDLGDIYFVDRFYYLIGDRADLRIESSPHVKFTTDQMVWRFVERVDGQPWLNAALTPKNGGATLSPFVTLAARA